MDWHLKLFETTAGAILGTVLATTFFYAITVTILRQAGKRSLAQMYAVDFTVAVALGSVMASVMLLGRPSIWTGTAAIATLAALQALVTTITARSKWFGRVVTAQPRLLLYRGTQLPNAMAAESVGPDVLEHAARKGGKTDTTRVHAIVLETDGRFSVIADSAGTPGSGFRELLDRARNTDPDVIDRNSDD